MSKTITIIFHPDGSSNLQTSGFQDSSCKEASAFLETALGERRSEKLTAEYFTETQTEGEHQEIGQ